MWDLMIRIEGQRVDASVPGWLLNATATYAAIDQAKRAAYELAANSETYGFDPDATYTIFYQIWDRALKGMSSVAFGRNVTGHSAVGLLPDPYYMASHGYRELRRSAAALHDWTSRSDVVAWRGSVTGDNMIAAPQDLPRIRLALACRDMPNTDVGLIGVHSTMNNGRPPGLLDDFVNAHALRRDRWNMEDFGRYRFAIDIDGHANAWGFLEKLIVGCCVLKVESPFEQWFYNRIKPWRHYVPIRSDLSNLHEIMEWCFANEAQCRWIADNGARVAASLTMARELPRTCRTLLAVAHLRRRARPRSPSTGKPQAPVRFLLEDALFDAEGSGCIDRAIDVRTHLIDAGMGGAMDFMKRHDLLRQRGEFALAQSDMEAAVAADPKNDEPPLRLGQFLASIGRHVSAIGYLEQARTRAPERDEIGIALAGSFLKLNRLDDAYRAVRHLPDDLPGWWADLRLQAFAAYTECRSDVRAIIRARREGDEFPSERRWELAIKLHALGRWRPAWLLCQDAMNRNPGMSAPIALAADIIARWQGANEALRYLSTQRHATDPAGSIDCKMAENLFELGRYREALETIDATVAGDDRHSVRNIVAFSQAMLNELPDLIWFCGNWMDDFPEEMLPAELVCAAQPVGSSIASASATVTLQMGQFWHEHTIPADVKMTMDSWTDRHPNLQRHIFDEESGREFLRAHYGAQGIRTFEMCTDPMMKAGFFRFAWLYDQGGVWIDADQRCTRPDVALLRRAATSDFAAVRSGYITGYLENVLVGARARSRQVEAALEMATATITNAVKRGEKPWRWQAIGPGLLTRVTARSICEVSEPFAPFLITPMAYYSQAVTQYTPKHKPSS